MSPVEDSNAQERRFNSLALRSPDEPDTPQPPEMATKDIGGRRLFAHLVRRASSLLDPDPERYNNRVHREGLYRTYPRTPGEEHLNSNLGEYEERFYRARGQFRSQISLVTPGSPNRKSCGPAAAAPRHQSLLWCTMLAAAVAVASPWKSHGPFTMPHRSPPLLRNPHHSLPASC